VISESMPAENGTILLVDDDRSMRRVLRVTLSGMGFNIVEASRGEEALTLARLTRFDAVLLDMDIPGMGGVEACRHIRHGNARLPILMLTAMDTEDDKVLGLDAGADDYITKPFRLRELAARLRSAVRRANAQDDNRNAPIRHGQLELDPVKYRVRKNGRSIHLSPKEFAVLHYLMINAGKPVSRTQLLNVVWGPDSGTEFVYLRIVMGHLRKKIEDDPLNPQYLQTVPSVGYSFNNRQTIN